MIYVMLYKKHQFHTEMWKDQYTIITIIITINQYNNC